MDTKELLEQMAEKIGHVGRGAPVDGIMRVNDVFDHQGKPQRELTVGEILGDAMGDVPGDESKR